MKFLLHLLILIAAGCLAFATIITGIDHKLLSSKIWLEEATKANVYTDLSKQLPDIISPGNTAEDVRSRSEVASVVTPAALRTEFTSYLPTVESYVRGTGPQPGVPLANLLNQFKDQAATTTSTKNDQMPLQDTPPTSTTTGASKPSPVLAGIQQALGLAIWLYVAGLILAVLVWLMAPAGKRWWQIVRLVAWTELSLAIWYGVLSLLPGMLVGAVSGNKDLSAAAPLFKSWLEGIARATNSFTLEALLVGAVVFGLALALQLLAKILPHSQTATSKSVKPTKPTSNLPVARS